MSKYQKFIFSKYSFDPLVGELSLYYSLDNQIEFIEKVFFDVAQINFEKIDLTELNRAFFNLHLIGGISYYKTYIPNKLIVQSGSLNASQIQFWEKLYTLGLGEFFYQNQIDFRGLVNFTPQIPLNVEIHSPVPPRRDTGGVKLQQESQFTDTSKENIKNVTLRCLVPIGGGKDSVVTAELLKKAGFDFTLFSLGDSEPQRETAAIVGKNRLIVRRALSPNLFELNQQGALNGHIPISAYIAFLSIVTSILYNYDYVILSNEHSANYGNIDYLGVDINHQYSKSLEFEKDFNHYVEQNISTNIKYFSLLRPFYELKIAEIFSRYPRYFSNFTSCNSNFKIIKKVPLEEGTPSLVPPRRDTGGVKPQGMQNPPTTLVKGGFSKWCGHCPKCAFVFTILAPFIPKAELIKIFGKNLFADFELKQLFLELLGKGKIKPFECVGAPEEVLVAFAMASEKGEYKEDGIMQMFEQKILPKIEDLSELKAKVFQIYLQESLVPEKFREIIKTN